jgi:hypothetical protein
MGAEDVRIAECGLGREVILERNFSLHIPSGRRLWACRTMRGLDGACQRRPRHGSFLT